MIKQKDCEEIYRVVNGELILTPLGRARVVDQAKPATDHTHKNKTRTHHYFTNMLHKHEHYGWHRHPEIPSLWASGPPRIHPR